MLSVRQSSQYLSSILPCFPVKQRPDSFVTGSQRILSSLMKASLQSFIRYEWLIQAMCLVCAKLAPCHGAKENSSQTRKGDAMPPIKILLVDDDEVVRSSLDEVLQLLTLWLCSSDFATGRVSRYSGSRIAMIGSAVRDPSLQFIQRN